MSEPILYILMRKDLPSMNAGKAMAQASHASNAFIERWKGRRSVGTPDDTINAINRWEESTSQGFGTVLVLAVTREELNKAVLDAIANKRVPSEAITDPTYPYKTTTELSALIPTSLDTIPRQVVGDQVNLWRSEITCAYVFGYKEQLKAILGHLPLHP